MLPNIALITYGGIHVAAGIVNKREAAYAQWSRQWCSL